MTPRLRHLRHNRYARGLLSALVPGLGQAAAGQFRRASLLVAPVVALLVVAAFLVVTSDPVALATRLVDPSVLAVLLAVQLGILALRLVAVLLALDLHRNRPGRGSVVVGALLVLVIAPQAALGGLTYVAMESESEVFAPAADSHPYVPEGTPEPVESLDPSDDPFLTPEPTATDAGSTEDPFASPSATQSLPPVPEGDDGRVTVLLIGQDSAPGRGTANTDTMIVASFDPTARTVSMLSIPRDMVNVPLPDGRIYARKINSLSAWVRHHPGQFPGAPKTYPGQAVLVAALSELTGVQIDYWAQVDFGGLIGVVDAVGGVNVNVTRAFCDPGYNDYGMDGFAVVPGRYHMNGRQALAYARVRHAAGESDFTRAIRQQEVILALRDRIVSGGWLRNPTGLLRALGRTMLTNVPPSAVSTWAPYGTKVTRGHVYSEVVLSPLVHSQTDNRGYVLIPNLRAIRDFTARLFPTAGTVPAGFSPMPDISASASARALPHIDCHYAPTPTPTPSESPSGSPDVSPSPTAPATPTPGPSASPTPRPTPTRTPAPTATPRPTPTRTPTVTPSPSAGATPTPVSR